MKHEVNIAKLGASGSAALNLILPFAIFAFWKIVSNAMQILIYKPVLNFNNTTSIDAQI